MHRTLSRLPHLWMVGEVLEDGQRHQVETCLPINISEMSMSFQVYLIMHMPRRSWEAFKGLMACFMSKQLCSQDFMPANWRTLSRVMDGYIKLLALAKCSSDRKLLSKAQPNPQPMKLADCKYQETL